MSLQSHILSCLAILTQDLGHIQPSVPLESYQTTKIYSPILQVKLRGDVIFHLGSVIILVVSGTLLWLGGRSESSGSACALHSPSLGFAVPPRAATASCPDSDEWDGPLSSPQSRDTDWSLALSNTSPKGWVASVTAEEAKHKQHFGPNEEGAFIIVIRLAFCL